MKAILENKINDLKAVIDEGVDLNIILDKKYGYTPLTLSATLNRSAMIEYLYLRGANIN